MSCITSITRDIISTCATQGAGGIETTVYIWNRKFFTATKSTVAGKENCIIALFRTTTGVGKVFTLTSVQGGADAGHDGVVTDKRATRFKHYFDFEAFEASAVAALNLDNMDDLVVAVVTRDVSRTEADYGDVYLLGVDYGLWRSSDTQRANNAQGARPLVFTSKDTGLERYSKWFLTPSGTATRAAAISALEALVTAP